MGSEDTTWGTSREGGPSLDWHRDWQRIDLNLLVVFAEIVRTGSVTEAGKVLGLSQPATSSALQRLRGMLDDPLFVKVGRGVQPTPRAIAMAPVVRDILERVRQNVLQPGGFDPARSRRVFRFAMSDIGESYFAPPLLKAMQARGPDLGMEVLSVDPRQLEAALEAGEIDVALGHHPDLTNAGIHQQALFTSRFVVMSAARSKQPPMDLDRFLRQPHIDVRTPGRSQEVVQQHMVALGMQRRVPVRVSRFLSLPDLLLETDYLAVVPLEVARYLSRINGLVVEELPFESPTFRLMQRWHTRFQDDPALKWLREQIRLQFRRSS